MRTRTSICSLALSLSLTALRAGAMPPHFHFTKIADDQGAPYASLGYPAINNTGMVGFYATFAPTVPGGRYEGLFIQSGNTIHDGTPNWISSIDGSSAIYELTMSDYGTIAFSGKRAANGHPVISTARLPAGGIDTGNNDSALAEVGPTTDYTGLTFPVTTRNGGVVFHAYRRSYPRTDLSNVLEILTDTSTELTFNTFDPQFENFRVTPNGQVIMEVVDSKNTTGTRTFRVTDVSQQQTYAVANRDVTSIDGYYVNDNGRVLITGDVGTDYNTNLYANAGAYHSWKRIVDTQANSAFASIEDVAVNNKDMFVMTAFGFHASAGVFIGGDYRNDRVLGPGDTLFGGRVQEAWTGRQAINEAGQIVLGVLMETGESMILLAEPATAGPADVTGKVRVTRSVYWYNRRNNSYLQTIQVKNTSSSVIQGPISVVFDDLNGADLKTINGHTAFTAPTLSPYVDVSNGNAITLAPGQSITLPLEFTGSTANSAGYHVRVLAGEGNR